MSTPLRFAAPLLAAAALALGSGCGNTCPTETPAQVQRIGSCTAKVGDTVSVPVTLCPTCNQSGAACKVDTSQASTGFIQLDPTVEACENVSSCASPAPACQANPLTCTFTVPPLPSGHSSFTILAFDPSTNGQISGTLDVITSGAPSCPPAI